MQIKMLQEHSDSLDGVTTTALVAGETYDLPQDLAGRMLAMGIATREPTDEAKDAGNAPENKDAGDSEEKKAPARRRQAPKASGR